MCMSLGHFYVTLNLEVGENLHHFPFPVALGLGGRSGWTYAYTCANSQVPYVHAVGNFYSNLTKELQLKWALWA
jgi:hypothetical protein